MDTMTEQERFWIFFVMWGIVGFFTWWFYKNATVSDKRKWHPWITFGSNALFAAAIYFIFPDSPTLHFVIPAVIVISWLNYRATTFCDVCGAMSSGWETSTEACRQCEAKVKLTLGGKVADMTKQKQIFVASMIVFLGWIAFQMFLPTLSQNDSSFLIAIPFIAFAVGVFACRCPNCSKFLTGGDGFTPFVSKCPSCHVVFK